MNKPYDRPLRGNRQCQCQGCFEYFTTVSGFDKHRYGPFTLDPSTRKCRTTDELKEKGWIKNKRGFWMRPGPGSAFTISRALERSRKAIS